MSTHTHHDVSQDKGPAFVGLIAGVVLLGAFMYGMVQWTNAQFAGHAQSAAPAAAGAPQH